MNNQELKKQAQTSAPHIKIAGGLWVMAMMIVLVAIVTWLVISVAWTNDYYAFSKGARDGAEAGSALLANLASIQTTKAWVMPLEVLGLSTFLLGFGFAFANIQQNVRLRGNTMAAVLPEMKARKNTA
ncbi:MAG: hypothetical protein CMJ45_13045 [Planctomyces sp.]|nr:hypothetical protein [Planctomyces sp.]